MSPRGRRCPIPSASCIRDAAESSSIAHSGPARITPRIASRSRRREPADRGPRCRPDARRVDRAVVRVSGPPASPSGFCSRGSSRSSRWRRSLSRSSAHAPGVTRAQTDSRAWPARTPRASGSPQVSWSAADGSRVNICNSASHIEVDEADVKFVWAVLLSAAVVRSAPFMGLIRARLRASFPDQWVAIVGGAVAAAGGLLLAPRPNTTTRSRAC